MELLRDLGREVERGSELRQIVSLAESMQGSGFLRVTGYFGQLTRSLSAAPPVPIFSTLIQLIV